MAPDKLTLKRFGGILDIDEFRNLQKNEKYEMLQYPLISQNSTVLKTEFKQSINKVPVNTQLYISKKVN